MEIVKLLLVASLASLIPGQLVRIDIAGDSGAITATDIFVFLTTSVYLIYALQIKKKLNIPVKIFFSVTLFTLAAAASLFLSLDSFAVKEVSTSALFLIRFFSYFLIVVVVYNLVKKQQILNWINVFLLIGFVFIVIGIIQLITFSDLSTLTSFGWDPHQKRIVSSLLDPNFAGVIFSTVAAFSTSLYLFKRRKSYLFLSILSFLAIILTFSRSSYLAAIIIILTIGALKSPRLIITSLIVFLLAFSMISQMRERIQGAITLDETAKARLASWQNAFTIFLDNPIFGVGFNTYRYTQAKYGFFPPGELGGHSGSGSDSSILLVLATTGVFGTTFYLFQLFSILNIFKTQASTNYLRLASFSSFLGLIVHSQFVNSLFFPQIMIIFWFVLGLNLVDDI